LVPDGTVFPGAAFPGAQVSISMTRVALATMSTR
jgi:hypothetical protein